MEILDRETFNAMYNAAQPPELADLAKYPSYDQTRRIRAVELAQRGDLKLKVDPCIHALGMDPFGTMLGRQMNGFLWVPSLYENDFSGSVAQNPLGPGEVGQGTAMPAGAIKVSLDSKDYPAFVVPVVPVPVEPKGNPVGFSYDGGKTYGGTCWDNMQDYPFGAEFTDPTRGVFVKTAGTPGMFGVPGFWKPKA